MGSVAIMCPIYNNILYYSIFVNQLRSFISFHNLGIKWCNLFTICSQSLFIHDQGSSENVHFPLFNTSDHLLGKYCVKDVNMSGVNIPGNSIMSRLAILYIASPGLRTVLLYNLYSVQNLYFAKKLKFYTSHDDKLPKQPWVQNMFFFFLASFVFSYLKVQHI